MLNRIKAAISAFLVPDITKYKILIGVSYESKLAEDRAILEIDGDLGECEIGSTVRIGSGKSAVDMVVDGKALIVKAP